MADPKKENPFQARAKKAKAGDDEEKADLLLEAPRGLGGKSPDDFIASAAEDEGFASEMEGAEGMPWDRAERGKGEREAAGDEFSAKEKSIVNILTGKGMSDADAREAATEIIALDTEE